MRWPAARPGGATPGPDTPGTLPPAAQGQLQARLAELEQTARQREQEAHELGLREGRAVGAEEAAARLEPVLERLSRSVEEIIGQRQRFRREAEEDVVKLALAVSRRILYRELSIDPDALLGVVEAAVKKLEAREVHRLRVHPADAAIIRKHFEQVARLQTIEVVADAGLERGAVLFDTARGALDASVETQLQEIQRGLSDLIQRGR
jgi:flagellar assembly protein FliH